MKLIVIDIDNLGWPNSLKKILNEHKICTLLKRDFGKKTLLALPKNNPKVLKAYKEYKDAIFRLKDDDGELKYENRFFRKILKEIKWFRVGVILRREKAVKILLRLLEK